MIVRRFRAVLVAALLGAAALSGCGNSGAPPQTLPPLSSATATTTSPSATATPTITAETLKRSAEQFVRAYFSEFDRAGQTGDLHRLRTFFSPTCEVCADDYAVLERNSQRGWHYLGYGSEILKLDAAEPEGKATNVLVTLRVRPGSRVDASGRVIKKLEGAGPLALSLSLQQQGDDWLIHDIINFGRVSP